MVSSLVLSVMLGIVGVLVVAEMELRHQHRLSEIERAAELGVCVNIGS
jgi:hypothetical protein